MEEQQFEKMTKIGPLSLELIHQVEQVVEKNPLFQIFLQAFRVKFQNGLLQKVETM